MVYYDNPKTFLTYSYKYKLTHRRGQRLLKRQREFVIRPQSCKIPMSGLSLKFLKSVIYRQWYMSSVQSQGTEYWKTSWCKWRDTLCERY